MFSLKFPFLSRKSSELARRFEESESATFELTREELEHLLTELSEFGARCEEG